MNLPADLLEQAGYLLHREQGSPREASMRRAVSTAYYALFHLLTTEAVQLIAPALKRPAADRMQRWFDHSEMKKVCYRYRADPLGKPLELYLDGDASADLRFVANAFIELQEARHNADYDLGSEWTRSKASQLIATVADAFNAWSRVRGENEATVFALSLLLWKNFEKER